jgi:hypothetical protein
VTTVLSLLVAVALLGAPIVTIQDPIDRDGLADYRLSIAIFQRFQDASERIARVVANDQTLRETPLFSQEVVQSGDVVEVAPRLASRLAEHPGLARALSAARISARDYTRFALALLTARMAFGFIESGVLRAVPAGAPTENVAFVRSHLREIDTVLRELGVDLK